MEASALSPPAGLARGKSTSARWLRLRSDEQLLGLFRSGSEDAFGVLHERYRQRLYAYARQMLGGSGSDAEDVMQDVFLRAYRSLRADERPVSVRAWLYRVAHNRCIDHLRRPVPPAAAVFEMSRTPLHDPMAEAERREDLRRLVADVRRLPEQQRSALLMREMDGLSYSDLAAALETSVPAVKSLLVRARIGLVEAIDARDADCSDIRHDLAASYDRGVRASGRARRHLRDCEGCTSYRTQLRAVRQGFAALSPSPVPAAGLAKLLGLGGSASGAAGGAAAAGSTATASGGAAAAISVSKVAVVVSCAVAVTGTAVEVRQIAQPSSPARHQRPAPSPEGAAAAGPAATSPVAIAPIIRHSARRLQAEAVAPSAPTVALPRRAHNGSGGVLAPKDDTAKDPGTDDTTPTDAAAGPADAAASPADGTASGDPSSLLPVLGDGTSSPAGATSTGSGTTGSGASSGNSASGDQAGSASSGSASTGASGSGSGGGSSSGGGSGSGSATAASTSSGSGSGTGALASGSGTGTGTSGAPR